MIFSSVNPRTQAANEFCVDREPACSELTLPGLQPLCARLTLKTCYHRGPALLEGFQRMMLRGSE